MQHPSVRLYPSIHIRTAEVATSEPRRLCLPTITYVPLAQNSLVSPTIERWCGDWLVLLAQPGYRMDPSLLALEPRQIAIKPPGRTVLPAAVYCAKDSRAALNALDPILLICNGLG